MNLKYFTANLIQAVRLALCWLALTQLTLGATLSSAAQQPVTTTPIKHVIVIIGENRSFDHVFATYVPRCSPGASSRSTQTRRRFPVPIFKQRTSSPQSTRAAPTRSC